MENTESILLVQILTLIKSIGKGLLYGEHRITLASTDLNTSGEYR